jgi:dolichyl-phosphate-mannose-protein mannosyltransferase
LALVLLLAGALRFWNLSWGLRHVPLRDESVFVESVSEMVRQGDLDQRFYEYPGLFFYLLYPPLASLPRDALDSARPYLVARGLVAASGVVSVALVFLLASRLVSPRAGLAAALLQAVSPVEVTTAHMVRPDVVLEVFALLALWAFQRVGTEARKDLLAGTAWGAAAAVKFTGFLLAPSYVLSRWLRPGPRLRGTILAVLAAAAVWLLATPSSWLVPHQYAQGVRDQWSYHYRGSGVAPRFWELSLYYLQTLGGSLGPVGSLFALAGMWATRGRLREWSPIVVFPLVMFVTLSTAEARWSRLMVPALGATAIVASLGFEALASRRARLAWALALGGALWPLADSIAYVRGIGVPDTRDRALDWIEAHMARGSRVLTNMPDLGLGAAGFEALAPTGSPDDDLTLALNADLVAWSGTDAAGFAGLAPVAVFERGEPRLEAPRIALLTIPDERRPRYREVGLATARVAASSDAADVAALTDGRIDTSWAGEVDGHETVEIRLASPIRLGRIELLLGDHPQRFARSLVLEGTADGSSWRRLRAIDGRGPVREQMSQKSASPSQVLIVDPVLVRGIRVEGWARRRHRWGLAEIRVDALDTRE